MLGILIQKNSTTWLPSDSDYSSGDRGVNSKEMSKINENVQFEIGVILLAARCLCDGPLSLL